MFKTRWWDCTWKQITKGYFKTSWVKQWLNKHCPGHRVKGSRESPFCKCFSLFRGPWRQFPFVYLGNLWLRVLVIKQGLSVREAVPPNANCAGISSSGGGHMESMSYIRLHCLARIQITWCWNLKSWASCQEAGGVWRTTCGDLIYRERMEQEFLLEMTAALCFWWAIPEHWRCSCLVPLSHPGCWITSSLISLSAVTLCVLKAKDTKHQHFQHSSDCILAFCSATVCSPWSAVLELWSLIAFNCI